MQIAWMKEIDREWKGKGGKGGSWCGLWYEVLLIAEEHFRGKIGRKKSKASIGHVLTFFSYILDNASDVSFFLPSPLPLSPCISDTAPGC